MTPLKTFKMLLLKNVWLVVYIVQNTFKNTFCIYSFTFFFFKDCIYLKYISTFFVIMVWKMIDTKMQHCKRSVFTTLVCKTEPAMSSPRQRNFLLTAGRQLTHHATAHNCSDQQPLDSWPTNLWWPHLNDKPWAYTYTVYNV